MMSTMMMMKMMKMMIMIMLMIMIMAMRMRTMTFLRICLSGCPAVWLCTYVPACLPPAFLSVC